MRSEASNLDAVIIGGGINGLFTALDLSLRGFSVALLERGAIGGGTSDRMHGLLHSGARYAVSDPKAAMECIRENETLSKIAPSHVINTGGLFVAISEEDLNYVDEFTRALRATGINYREENVGEVLREEPFLSPQAKLVISVPDKVVKARELMSGVAMAAHDEGALIIQDAEVIGINVAGDAVAELIVRDNVSGETKRIGARIVINAAGPWASRIASMAGISVDVMATMGVMVVYERLLNHRVINRLRPPSDGDIVLPYGARSIAGTTALIVEDPDNVEISDEDVGLITREAAAMIPAIARTKVLRSYAAVRPLIKMKGVDAREATRDFAVVRHESPSNMVSIIGGKFTTGRLVGEMVGDVVAGMLGSSKPSRTKEYKLPSDPYAYAEKASPFIRSTIRALANSLDDEYGRIAAYASILSEYSREGRAQLGW